LNQEKKRRTSCPFKPKVNITSKLIVDSSEIIASKNFIQRQEVFQQIARFNKNELSAEK